MDKKVQSIAIKASLMLAILFPLDPRIAEAQTWHAQSPGANIVSTDHAVGGECSATLYDPEHFFFPDGDFGFLSQGNNPNATCSGIGTVGVDSIFSARFDRSTATWTSPGETECPTLIGRYMTGGYPQNCGYSTTDPAPLASPDIVKIGSRYYMAFSGGNADAAKGHVFLAFSDDGQSWITFKWDPKPEGYEWRPVIYPYYGGPGDDHCYEYGVAQLALVYDADDTSTGPNGTFYLYLHYVHGTVDRENEVLAFRAPFNPGFAWGFGFGNMEICQKSSSGSPCSWVPHSGKLVWDYNNKPVAKAGDPVLEMNQSARLIPGGFDIHRDPQRNNWLRVFRNIGNGRIQWQSTTSMASGLWTAQQDVDLQPMHSSLGAQYPSYEPDELYPGLWHGTAGGRTGMWIRMPVDYAGCTGLFRGLGVASVAFNFF